MNVVEQPTARSTDPLASFVAADGITDVAVTELQTAILMALDRPMTHDECRHCARDGREAFTATDPHVVRRVGEGGSRAADSRYGQIA